MAGHCTHLAHSCTEPAFKPTVIILLQQYSILATNSPTERCIRPFQEIQQFEKHKPLLNNSSNLYQTKPDHAAINFRRPIIQANSFLLPYEIHARIWMTAAPSTPTDITCCKARTSYSYTECCIRPFSEILEVIDPISLTRHASKPSSPNAKFVFCSMSCFTPSMRLSTASKAKH
jgi:hypothetical protein